MVGRTQARLWTVQAAWLLVGLLALGLPTASGIIDPKFTPADLIKDAQSILTCTVTAGKPADTWQLADISVLKGKRAPSDPQATLSLAECEKEQVETIRKLVGDSGREPVIVFLDAGDKAEHGYIHVDGVWLEIQSSEQHPGQWNVRRLARKMSGTFAGGTEMLIRLTRHLLADPTDPVPVSVGVSWMHAVPRMGKVQGHIGGMEALEFAGDRQAHLFVASSQGDRIYRAKQKDEAFDDVTAELKLDTRSRRFVWADLDGDGHAELISFDGAAIHVRKLAADRTFKPDGPDLEFKGECLALSACNLPGDGSPAILVSTTDLPLLLTRDEKGKWRQAPLPGGEVVAKAGSATMACIVADLDNDGYWDVLQPRAKGGVLWKGRAQGLADPVPSSVANADGPACFALGDFTQDGCLDIFISGAKGNELWENDGKAGFRPIIRFAGSLGYKSTAGASRCCATDLNHDGRPDLCLLYSTGEMAYHFNRGFGCFGEEGELRLAAGEGAGPDSAGQVACAVADFNGDGSLDLAVAFADGQIRCFYNEAYSKPTVKIGLSKGSVGPITVSVWRDRPVPLCLGAASIFGPQPRAVLPLTGTSNVTIKWSAPGRPGRTRKIGTPQTCPDEGFDVLLTP